jgi:hypothetical protein
MAHTNVPGDYFGPAYFEGELTPMQKDLAIYAATAGVGAFVARSIVGSALGMLSGAALGLMVASMVIKKRASGA